jgi:hypothetical protein
MWRPLAKLFAFKSLFLLFKYIYIIFSFSIYVHFFSVTKPGRETRAGCIWCSGISHLVNWYTVTSLSLRNGLISQNSWILKKIGHFALYLIQCQIYIWRTLLQGFMCFFAMAIIIINMTSITWLIRRSTQEPSVYVRPQGKAVQVLEHFFKSTSALCDGLFVIF